MNQVQCIFLIWVDSVPGIFLPCEIAGRARNDELQSPNFLSL